MRALFSRSAIFAASVLPALLSDICESRNGVISLPDNSVFPPSSSDFAQNCFRVPAVRFQILSERERLKESRSAFSVHRARARLRRLLQPFRLFRQSPDRSCANKTRAFRRIASRERRCRSFRAIRALRANRERFSRPNRRRQSASAPAPANPPKRLPKIRDERRRCRPSQKL